MRHKYKNPLHNVAQEAIAENARKLLLGDESVRVFAPLSLWSVEPIDSNSGSYKLYAGRDNQHHGAWLCTISELDMNAEKTLRMIESAPRFMANAEFLIDSIPEGFEMPDQMRECIELLKYCLHLTKTCSPTDG